MIDLAADTLRVFGDESFDAKAQYAAAVAGLIGTEREWNIFENKWAKRTGEKEFHANECETEHAHDSDKNKHKENLRLYEDLTKLIAESGLRGFGVAFDLKSFRENFPGVQEEADIGYFRCFTHLLHHCADVSYKERRKIEEFVMHNRRGKEYNVGLIYQYFMQRPEWKRDNIFLNQRLSFDTSQNPRIQAADLVAREAMKYMESLVGPRRRLMRKSLKTLATANNRIQFDFYEGPYFKSWRDSMEELEKRRGMNQEEYRRWLTVSKLPDTWSNRIHFIIWLEEQDVIKSSHDANAKGKAAQ